MATAVSFSSTFSGRAVEFSLLKGLDVMGVGGPLATGPAAETPTPLPIPEKTRPSSLLIPGSPVGPIICA
jgi:hypothetical protein